MHIEMPQATGPKHLDSPSRQPVGPSDDENILSRTALRFAAWMEKWFPDAFVFVLLAVLISFTGSLAIGAQSLRSSKRLAMVFGT